MRFLLLANFFNFERKLKGLKNEFILLRQQKKEITWRKFNFEESLLISFNDFSFNRFSSTNGTLKSFLRKFLSTFCRSLFTLPKKRVESKTSLLCLWHTLRLSTCKLLNLGMLVNYFCRERNYLIKEKLCWLIAQLSNLLYLAIKLWVELRIKKV